MNVTKLVRRDLLRHEYGHAVANANPALLQSRCFSDPFGTPPDGVISSVYS